MFPWYIVFHTDGVPRPLKKKLLEGSGISPVLFSLNIKYCYWVSYIRGTSTPPQKIKLKEGLACIMNTQVENEHYSTVSGLIQ